jgi:phosphatidylglycerophosphate synthase
MALMTEGELVGIYTFTRNAVLDFVRNGPEFADSLEDLDAWFALTGSVQRISVEEDKWQRIATVEDQLEAERKLDRWLVKPTDGIFARMNRGVSIPVSRQLIRFPITPNMVSLFTLGVSFLCGLFFAAGGYRNMLLGAVLGVAASILDGCDGEVARLKLQDSAFGCWLETVCDYLYYLFMFVGMTIGLLRTSGTRFYLLLGALLVFGAMVSFVVSSLQRQRMTAADRPEQFLAKWQKEAATRRSNPFLYLGRHTEFLVRRCFLPYAILVFALLDITHVAFILSVVGANIFWPIALYSYCTFQTGR